MTAPDVRIAAASDEDALMSCLMLAFGGDPCMRYTFDKAKDFTAVFRGFASAMCAGAVDSGTAWIVGDGAAAALWLAPGKEGDSETLGELVGKHVAPEKMPVIEQVIAGMQQHHPHEPHWYLPMIGVDPARQGQGLGSALLKEALRRCDEDGLPAYLESSNPKNIPLYERHGFEVVGVIQPGDFPPLVPMLRPARG
jgi:ribosomal protein S18 acetylase RimI-like enzyme